MTMYKGTVIIFSLFFLSLCFFSEECQRKQREDFNLTLKGDTYTKAENSSVYYSTGDIIRVDFYLPEGRPITLDSLVVFTTGVNVFKTKFFGLNHTDVKRYINPASGGQFEPEVSNRTVSKLTLIAKATTTSSHTTMSLFVSNLTGCAWECEKKKKEDFSVTLRGHTYSETGSSMTFYSTGDVIRVDFYLPGERPVTLQYLQIVPTNVSVFKMRFQYLNDTETNRYDNPVSHEQLTPEVSHRVVSKLTLTAKAAQSSKRSMTLLVSNLTACDWVFDSPTTPNNTVTSNASEPWTSETYVTSTNTSTLAYNSSSMPNGTDSKTHNNTHDTTINSFTPNILMYVNASNVSTPQSPDIFTNRQNTTSKPFQTTVYAVRNGTNGSEATASPTKDNNMTVTSGRSVTSVPGFLQTTNRSKLFNETEAEERKVHDTPDSGLSRENQISILAAVFSFLEVTLAAMILFLQRHKLCSGKGRRRVKQAPASTIIHNV